MHTKNSKVRSTKSTLIVPFLAFSLPALILLFFFMGYTIQKQKEERIGIFQNQLDHYGNAFQEIIDRCEDFSTNLNALDSYFAEFLYADNQLDTHLITCDIMHSLSAMQSQEPVYGGFFLYKDAFSYYYPSYQLDYPRADQLQLKAFLINAAKDRNLFNVWIPFSFTDRTVLLYITGLEGSIYAVMLDPSLNEFMDHFRSDADSPQVFFASTEGELYSTGAQVPEEITARWTSDLFQSLSCETGKFQILKYEFPDLQMFLCFLIPNQTLWSMLNALQKFLILAIVLLFFILPAFMYYLSHVFLTPLAALEATMKQVGEGNLECRAEENVSILELQNFSIVFNQMLNDIQNLKLKAYEKQLQMQQAQLQYLQLQIRPHFFLNCLKGIYSMAEKQPQEIKEVVLALSGYFRYIFRNIKKWSTLAEELHAVTSYVHLQQLNYSRRLALTMDIAANTTEDKILPWSLLTFIENSIKHSRNTASLRLRIKSSHVTVDNVRYLNILVCDNGGGFPEDVLQQLEHLGSSDQLYNDYHVGISNIYYRMNLAYHGEAMLLFYNQNEEACSELYIPLEQSRKGENFS